MVDHDVNDVRDEELDDVLLRVRDTLSPLPPADPAAIARVLAAVHGRPARAVWRARVAAWLGGARGLALAGVGAALAIAFVARGTFQRSDAPSVPQIAQRTPAIPSPESTMALRQTATPSAEEAPIPVQFVLDARSAPSATTVSVVGDFNDWNAASAPLERLPGTSLWTVTLPVKPGRHVYSFVLDGKRWIADPRAPRAPDNDFGRPGSVLIVGAP